MKLLNQICLFFIFWFIVSAPSVLGAGLQDKPNPEQSVFIVLIMDGLRPDFITPELMPNVYRLQQEGASFTNSHAIFPTSTRVNSASLSTGFYPGMNGVVSNNMYVKNVLPNRSFSTGDYKNLIRLKEADNGTLLTVPTLAERLHANGKKLVAISSGSTGSAFLLNPVAIEGVGVLINGYFQEGNRIAFPDSVNRELLQRYGAAPRKEETDYNAAVDWTENILVEYVIPELKPDVVLNWLTEPNNTLHSFGSGSEEVKKALRNNDRKIGLILEKLRGEGLYQNTSIIVTSDHGFSLTTHAINTEQKLIEAGLKKSDTSDDVVLADNSKSVLIHVKNRNRGHIREIVRYLQSREWADVIFTMPEDSSDKSDSDPYGWVDGTFSLDLIGLSHATRGPDILFTFPWSSDKNAYGYEGTQMRHTDEQSGPVKGQRSGHGGISPWDIRNSFIAWGADFKKEIVIRNPVSIIDITPTILNLLEIPASEPMDGRFIREAVIDGPDYEKIPVSTQTFETESLQGKYKTFLQISRVDGDYRYIDKGWRED